MGPSGSYAWGKVAGGAADLPKVTGCRYHRHEPGGAEPGLVLPQADLIIAIQLPSLSLIIPFGWLHLSSLTSSDTSPCITLVHCSEFFDSRTIMSVSPTLDVKDNEKFGIDVAHIEEAVPGSEVIGGKDQWSRIKANADQGAAHEHSLTVWQSVKIYRSVSTASRPPGYGATLKVTGYLLVRHRLSFHHLRRM